MKPLKLILDYTENAKAMIEDLEKYSFKSEFVGQDTDETTLGLWYADNGEHAATFPEVRTASAGRKAAKTFMKYCDCEFIDKTK